MIIKNQCKSQLNKCAVNIHQISTKSVGKSWNNWFLCLHSWLRICSEWFNQNHNTCNSKQNNFYTRYYISIRLEGNISTNVCHIWCSWPVSKVPAMWGIIIFISQEFHTVSQWLDLWPKTGFPFLTNTDKITPPLPFRLKKIAIALSRK